MEFIVVLAFVILFIMLIKSRREISDLKNRINFLDGKVRDLYDKAFYNYEQIKAIKNGDVPEEAVKESPNESMSVPPVQNGFNPYRANQNSPAYNWNVPPVQSVFGQNIPQTQPPAAAAVNAPDVQTPAAINRPNFQRPVQPSNSRTADAANKFKSFENWLGTRLFNVVASLMIFIGLVMFCTLGYEYITDTMKMAAMFLVSGSFIALGAFFSRQNKSVFSLGLTGCGFGAFFISILLSHVYFNALPDIAAFGLLLLWSMLALFMSKKLDSVMLSVTAHMGTAVSICFAFSLGFSAERIILPVIYQMASIAVIIIGNIFFCRKTYRFGLFMSEALLVYTSIVMCAAFEPSSVMPEKISPVFTTVIFAVQFLTISFVSYLIAISTAALKTEKAAYKNIDDIMLMAHILNKVLWTAGIISSVGVAAGFTLKNVFGIESMLIPTLAVCTAALCHLFVTLFMSEKLNFNETLSKLSVWFISVVVMLALFIQSADRELLHGVPFLCVYIGLIMLIIHITKNRKLNHLAAFLIGCEMTYMALYGYFAVENVVISIIYMVIVGLVALLHWFMQSGASRERRFTFFKMTEYLWLSVSIIPINVSEFSDISFPLILSEFALMNIITYLCKYGREHEPELRIAVKIESLTTIYVSLIALMFNQSGSLGDVTAIKIVFIILAAGLTGLYIKDFAVSNSTALQVLSAATLSGFVTAVCVGFYASNKFADLYVSVLHCKPFFFISAVMLSLIYYLNKNHNLRAFTWTALGIDAFLMLFFGYRQIFREFSYDTVLHIISIAICTAHAVFVGLILYYTWSVKEEHKRESSLTIVKVVEYFWINFSVFSISLGIAARTSLFTDDLTFALIALINVIIILSGYRKSSNKLNNIINVSVNILIYMCIVIMSHKYNLVLHDNPEMKLYVIRYTIRFALILLTLGLFYLTSREFIKSKSVMLQAYIGFTATLLVHSACRGMSDMFTIQYIFSIVTMITALICIVAGFAANAKGLRVYGLIVVMLCVIKLVTFDIGEADSLSRVAAFVVGGIVCFVISGIYNKVESKFNSEEITSSQNEYAAVESESNE